MKIKGGCFSSLDKILNMEKSIQIESIFNENLSIGFSIGTYFKKLFKTFNPKCANNFPALKYDKLKLVESHCLLWKIFQITRKWERIKLAA